MTIKNVICDIDGVLMHDKAHDPELNESRGDLCIMRGVNVSSARLGISGQCDVVEFMRGEDGISLSGKEGLWKPYPVEYKRGESKTNDCDMLQLCAQAMCLEEMLCCSIPEGALYYGQPRRRQRFTSVFIRLHAFPPDRKSEYRPPGSSAHGRWPPA